MIKLEIRTKSSPDVELDKWKPTSAEDVYFLVELEIGEAGQRGASLFQVVIATPEGLRHMGDKYPALLKRRKNDLIVDRNHLVFAAFSWPRVWRAIDAIVEKCRADDYMHSVLKLQRYFEWEYEDYVHAEDPQPVELSKPRPPKKKAARKRSSTR